MTAPKSDDQERNLEKRLASLRERFRLRLLTDHEALVHAVASGDADRTLVTVHRLAGVAASFGYVQIGECAAEVQVKMNCGASAEELKPALDRLIAELGRYGEGPR